MPSGAKALLFGHSAPGPFVPQGKQKPRPSEEIVESWRCSFGGQTFSQAIEEFLPATFAAFGAVGIFEEGALMSADQVGAFATGQELDGNE